MKKLFSILFSIILMMGYVNLYAAHGGPHGKGLRKGHGVGHSQRHHFGHVTGHHGPAFVPRGWHKGLKRGWHGARRPPGLTHTAR